MSDAVAVSPALFRVGHSPDASTLPVPLRVGVRLESTAPTWWVHALVTRIKTIPEVEICVVIHSPFLREVPESRIWRCYHQCEEKVFGGFLDPLQIVDEADWLSSLPIIHLGQGDADMDIALHELEAFGLDVVLDFTWGQPRPALATLGGADVWRYRFGEKPAAQASAVGIQEVAENRAISKVELVRLIEDGNELLLRRALFRTAPLSPRKNRESLLRKSVAMIAYQLRESYQIKRSGQSQNTDGEILPARRENILPQGLRAVAAVARISSRVARRALEKTTHVRQWFLATCTGEVDPFQPLMGFVPLFPPKDRFWADPFPYERRGRRYLFIEELLFATQLGHISVMEWTDSGRWSAPTKVLARPYHLSYPFLFEWEGTLFMLPETGANRSVEVYRCHRFPDDWRLESVLLDKVYAVDATLSQIDGRWWMFVTQAEDYTEPYDELHLYYADTPFGPWIAHGSNPVKSDVRSARPAGNLFRHQNRLIRPAQECAPLYGSAIVLNEIQRLDTSAFIERPLARVSPNWMPNLLGCHTFNRSQNVTAIDGFMSIPKWRSQ